MPRFLLPPVVCALLIFASSNVLHADQSLDEHFAHRHGVAVAAAGDAGQIRQYAPSRLVDVKHLLLDVTPDFDAQSIAGEMTLTFAPVARPLGELKLDAKDLAIDSVVASVAVLDWSNTGEQVVITFENEIAPDVESWVKVKFAAEEPANGLFFRTPAMGYPEGDTHLWTQGEPESARYWYPGYDYPNEKFTSEMICHVPTGMVALSNGRLVSRSPQTDGERVTWHWLQDKPHVNYLITLCAGYFEKLEDRHGDLELAFWAPQSRIEYATNSFQGTREMIAFYEEEIGVAYPWARYDQVVVDDFVAGGMENTAQTTLNDRTLYPDEFKGTRSSRGLIAHEVVHQWFGNLVTCKDWSQIWLNEGFATYYDALYTEHADGRDEFLLQMYGNANNVLRQANDNLPMTHRGYENPWEQFGYRAYPKGAWILHMLRSELGPDLFRQCVKTYLERHAYDTVTTSDLIAVLEDMTGRDWDRFFDQYVFHAHHPELKIDYSWDARTRLAKVSVQQVQQLGDSVLLFHVPLKLRFKSGDRVTDHVVQITRRSEDFYVAVPEQPEIVRVDPDYALLAKIEFNPPDAMLYAQLTDQDDMIGRLWAIEQLSKKKEATPVAKLAEALRDDGFWGVRRAAADALGTIHNDAARQALLSGLEQSDERVRRAVVGALGGFYHDDTPEQMLAVIEDAANPDIAATAVPHLSAYSSDEITEALEALLQTRSYREVLAAAALDAVRNRHETAFIAPVMEVLDERGDNFRTRDFGDALGTLAQLGRERDDRAGVREFIETRLQHPKRAVREAAIRALGTLGDARSLPVLATFTHADADDPLRRAADAAMRSIRENRPAAVELGTLRDEVKELRDTARELESKWNALKEQWDAMDRAETE